jgi:UDP-glucose/galactose:(glucosyl)LPS alpha-1,2-glucosyl/galactosyltransferase
MNERIAIACAANQRYFKGMAVMIYSIVAQLPKDVDTVFYIIDGGIDAHSMNALKEKVNQKHAGITFELHKPDMHLFKSFPVLYSDNDAMSYSRLLFANIITESKYLYIDVDILVTKDITELWKMSFDNKTVLVIQDPFIQINKNDFNEEICSNLNIDLYSKHFNAGVIFINNSQWKELQISEKTILFLKEHPDWCRWHDQSALNAILHNQATFIDGSWNIRSETIDTHYINAKDGYCIHYTSNKKPWLLYCRSYSARLFYITFDLLFGKKASQSIRGYKMMQLRHALLPLMPLYFSMKLNWCKLFTPIKIDAIFKVYTYWLNQKKIFSNQQLKKNHHDYLAWWTRVIN